MFTLKDLAEQVEKYRCDQIAFDDFEDWFRTNSRGVFGSTSELIDAVVAVESALSRFRFEDANEEILRNELSAFVSDQSHSGSNREAELTNVGNGKPQKTHQKRVLR